MKIKVQIIFYSMYGHVYQLAEAIAQGAKEVTGVEVGIFQVPELVPDHILEQSGAKKVRSAFAQIPLARVEQLPDADAIIFGTPTRFGNMCS
jgi:multimeric flavodoxin WrbA